MTRIFLVDDHPLFAESLAHRLNEEAQLEVIGIARDEAEAEQYLETDPAGVDLVLLDIRMSDGETEGLELAELIRKEYRHIKVIILSMHKQGAYIYRMFNAGIAGYLLKSSHIDEVLAAIHTVNQGRRYYPEEIRQEMDQFIMSGQPVQTERVELTPTEAYILEQIAEGMSSREIADKMGNKESTVEVHRRNIFSKFGVNKVTKLIREAIRQGYLSLED